MNCKISTKDVDRAIAINGITTPLLQGRTVAPKQVSHRAKGVIVPRQIYNANKRIHLFIDICYINKLAFLVSISDNIQYILMQYLESKTKKISSNL